MIKMGLFDEFKSKKLIKDLGNWDKDVRENSAKSLELALFIALYSKPN